MKKLRFLFTNIEEIIAGSIFILMTGITVINVFTRYFGNFVISAAEELSRYCFVWMTFFGAALCTKHGRQIAIDFVILAAPNPLRSVMKIIANIVILTFLVVLGYYSLKLAMLTSTQTSTLGIPLSYILYPIPFAVALILIRSINKMIIEMRVGFKSGGQV
jgi:TRAP-type transport system small permease protein